MGRALLPALIRSARLCFPGLVIGSLRRRAQLITVGARHADLVEQFYAPAPDSALAELMRARPEMIGVLVWPYQCAAWDVRERLIRILAHYDEIDRIGAPFKFSIDQKLILKDLGSYWNDLKIVVDQPKWFMREGGLTVNIFIKTFRAFSIAFSFYRSQEGKLQAFVGSVQGRNTENILDTYRELTKAMHGLRPRDLLFEYLRALCRHVGVEEILAVSDDQRHHRHSYFNKQTFPLNYDEIWRDRGGHRHNSLCFSIPLSHERRDLTEIKPNKRSLYRKRYALLDDLEMRFGSAIHHPEFCRFTDT